MYKQIIIARKDLDMSSGKLAAQVSHASMAFLTSELRDSDTVTAITKTVIPTSRNINRKIKRSFNA